jgi:Ca-activated chloride channel family protein
MTNLGRLDWATLDWATPWGALVLLVPLMLFWLAWRRRSKLAAWADPHLVPWAVAATGEGNKRDWRRLADWLAWALLALAAAGPRLPLQETADTGSAPARHVMSVMVALDVSASMSANDIAPDRLSRARLELTDLAARLKGERAGLLLFAGEAGLLLPPTDDASLLDRAVAQAGPELLEAPGTNLAAALDLAAQSLAAEKTRSRAVLLVTDAEADSLSGPAGEAARSAAVKLKTAGIPLYVLAVASRAGATIPLAEGGYAERDGAQVISRPALESYSELAGLAGGRLAEVADGDADWQRLYDNGIATLPGDALAAGQVRAWRTLHTWPLVLSLMLFMFAWLPRAAPSLALVLMLLLPPGHDAMAGEMEQAAWQAYRSGHFNEAIRLYAGVGTYPGQMGAGAAAWKLKDYPAAVRYFGNALLLARTEPERTDALYNLGNAYFALTRWQTAAEAYRAVLHARPNDTRARINLVETERQLARRRFGGPMKSDLRGRRGSIAEGEVNLDWDKELAIPEFEPGANTTLVEQGSGAAGARKEDAATAGSSLSLDAHRLQSGLRKLERLEERPRTLLRGLLKQDRVGAAQDMELAPW